MFADLRDDRGRKVLGTLAERENDKYCIVCTTCDGEYVDFHNFTGHLVLHRPVKIEKLDPATVPQPKSNQVECIVLSSDSEDELPNPKLNGKKAQTFDVSSDSDSSESAARTRVLRERVEKRRASSMESNNSTDSDSYEPPKKTRKTKNARTLSDCSDSDFEPTPSKKQKATTSSHTAKHSDAKQTPKYRCKYCGKGFSSVLDVNLHVKKCADWLKTLHYCEFCSDKFRTKTGLDNHYRNNHQTELPEQCTYCVSCFATKADLFNHEQKKHITGNVVICAICDKRLSSRYEKDKHVEKEHPWGEYECKICSRTTKTEQAMKDHMKTVHPK